MSKVNQIKCSNNEANRLTKTYICESLLRLLKEKDFDSITITELVKDANVSRMGFYNNYKSKYDVLKCIVISVNDLLLKEIGRPFKKDIGLDWYMNLFENVEKNSETMLLLYKAGFQNDYIQIMNEYILSKQDIKSSEMAYKRLIWNGGIQNIVWRWVIDGMKESKEEIAKLCFEFFHKGEVYC